MTELPDEATALTWRQLLGPQEPRSNGPPQIGSCR
jgi:hypothetical protein